MNGYNTSTPNANKLNLDNGYNKQCIDTPDTSKIPSHDESFRSRNVIKTVTRQKPMVTEDDQFNKSLLTLLNEQHDLQRQSLNMMKDINCSHEYNKLMQYIPIYDRKNMDLLHLVITTRKSVITYKW